MNTPAAKEGPLTAPGTAEPLHRFTAIVENALLVLVWTLQAGAAASYLLVVAQPAAWRDVYATDPVGTICFWSIGVGMACIWAISLWEESRKFYDRRIQRLHRKLGLLGHLSALLIAVATALELPGRIGWLAFLGTMSFCALATWAVWMQSRFLPDEDQAVIDAIISRGAAQRAAVFDASERQKRRVRLTAIVESLGYTLTDTPAGGGKSADAPAVTWKIPAGKHAPLVYFIRNGNRLKIGTTSELKRRIRTLALRPENVVLLADGGQSVERAFHKQFAEHRIGNTEWFAYEGTLAEYVTGQVDQTYQRQKGQQK